MYKRKNQTDAIKVGGISNHGFIKLIIILFILTILIGIRIGINNQLKKVNSLNLLVNKSVEYGIPIVEIDSFHDILEGGIAACGFYVEYLFREVKQRGYEARAVGMRSYYCAANHAVLEVKIYNHWYTFDPSHGVYWKYSVAQLKANPALVENKIIGNSTLKDSKYLKSDFYENIFYETVNEDIDVLDFNDVDSSKIYRNMAFDEDEIRNLECNFPTENGYGLKEAFDNSLSTYLSQNSYEQPAVIEMNFKKKIKINKLLIYWESKENSAKELEILFRNNDGKYEKLVNKQKMKKSVCYTLYLREEIETSSLKFVINESYGQERLLIKEIVILE